MAALVPELYVSDLTASLAFYHALGFRTLYARPEEAFARIEREGAELMIEEPRGRTWLLGPLDRPFGRGVNLQITVGDAEALFASLPLDATVVMAIEERTYRRTIDTVTVRQFVLADPDGYLLRFSQLIETRPLQELPA